MLKTPTIFSFFPYLAVMGEGGALCKWSSMQTRDGFSLANNGKLGGIDYQVSANLSGTKPR